MEKVRYTLTQLTLKTTSAKENGWWFWWGCAAVGMVIHGGTALLRLDSFWPSPRATDFASYYAGAWAVRLNASSLTWSDELLDFLEFSQNLTINPPPVHNSPPIWAWLLQPFTYFNFPQAAILWLCLLLILVICSHGLLMQIAGYANWRLTIITLPLTLTFGPLFLNLTLGQNGPFLLLSLATLGISLQNKPRGFLLSVPLWLLAVGAKLFPAIWLGCLVYLRRWRVFLIASLFCLAVFGLAAVLKPEINKAYWFEFLPTRNQQFVESVSINDQSLNGYLSRLGQQRSYQFPGLTIDGIHQITWSFPWELSSQTIQVATYGVLFFLGLILVYAWQQNKGSDADAILYSLALFSTLFFAHMERYNHIIALPAMAWLWQLNSPYRKLTLLAYGLFGLSRLNHLLALLPSPLGPVATGFGLFSVLLLLLGIAHALVRHPAKAAGEQSAPYCS